LKQGKPFHESLKRTDGDDPRFLSLYPKSGIELHYMV
jgi:hypothetical protein